MSRRVQVLSICWITVGLGGCEVAKAVDLGAGGQTRSVSALSPLDAQELACQHTGGSWQRRLLSCHCAAGALFTAGRGCGPVHFANAFESARGRLKRLGAEPLRRVLETLYDGPGLLLSADLTALDDAETRTMLTALDVDPTQVLTAMTLPPPRAKAYTVVHLERATADNVDRLWGADREVDYPAAMNVVGHDPLDDPEAALGVGQLACAATLAAAGLLPSRADGLCASVYTAAAQITGQRPFVFDATHFTEEGIGCTPDCAYVANWQDGDQAVTYSVVMQDYVPLSRMLRVGAADGTQLVVFLGAQGRREAAVLRYHRFRDSGDGAILQSTRTVLDGRWHLLATESTARGDTVGLTGALAGNDDRTPLVTDQANRTPWRAAQQAVVIDSGIDVRLPGLRSRLAMAPHTTLAGWSRNPWPFSYPSSNPLHHALLLLDDDDLEGRHGTRVASVLAANLPELRVSFLPASDPATLGVTASVRDAWVQHIASSQAAVVNVSITYSRVVADCEAFFGAIFSALPHVLFVVAAGNSGAREPSGTCPAGLGYRYGNVLTVAGVDASGTVLHPHSNRGIFTAKVAAPYVGLAAEVNGSTAPPVARLAPMQGTSFSAAWASNVALRYLVGHPQASPSQVIEALMNACQPLGLEVACGGPIDLAALEGGDQHGWTW